MPDLSEPHAYISTACLHSECGACRNTCKYCGAPCSHSCHPQDTRNLPVPWTDQAREIALALLGELSAERRTRSCGGGSQLTRTCSGSGARHPRRVNGASRLAGQMKPMTPSANDEVHCPH